MIDRDLAMFPGATDVVRVKTNRWKQRHAKTLERVLDKIKCFLKYHEHLPFDVLVKEFERNDPRVKVGDQFAHVMYGPIPLFLENGELKLDIRGLVYKPQARMEKGNIIVEIGGEV